MYFYEKYPLCGILCVFILCSTKPRESTGTGIYHVMLRGNNHQDIFDDTYRFMLCAVLERACHIEPAIKRYGIYELTTRHKQLKKEKALDYHIPAYSRKIKDMSL